MNFGRALQSLDAFKQVSKDLTRGSATGGLFTAMAYGVIVLVVISEFGSFMSTSYSTNVVMDANKDTEVQINFDIALFDLPCQYLKVAAFDKFGQEKMNSTQNFQYIPLDHEGSEKGRAYSAKEVATLEVQEAAEDMTEEEKAEIDADWSSSSDHFKHHDFQAAITFHEYTFVNFYAEWCSHCRQFHPMWMEIANRVGEKTLFTDADGKQATVKFLKANCVDFEDACRTSRIQAFPTLRLYKRDGAHDPFQEHRNAEKIEAFLKRSIENSHRIVSQHHNMFNEGCQIKGTLHVPRIQGHFFIQADAHASLDINPALTNVSHRVNHFSFGSDQKGWHIRNAISTEVVKNTHPLDGKSFYVEHFHQAPQHYIKVVSTYLQGSSDIFYQLTHADRTRTLHKGKASNFAAPQARFAYDFSPMSVIVRKKSKQWYEFLTSLFAILGGTYTVMELSSGAVETVHHSIKEAMGKAN